MIIGLIHNHHRPKERTTRRNGKQSARNSTNEDTTIPTGLAFKVASSTLALRTRCAFVTESRMVRLLNSCCGGLYDDAGCYNSSHAEVDATLPFRSQSSRLSLEQSNLHSASLHKHSCYLLQVRQLVFVTSSNVELSQTSLDLQHQRSSCGEASQSKQHVRCKEYCSTMGIYMLQQR
jgi:hypothetical protein